MIALTCPHCQAQEEVPPIYTHFKLRCDSCGKLFPAHPEEQRVEPVRGQRELMQQEEKQLISDNPAIDELAAELHALGEQWQAIGQWGQPSPERALQFMVTEAGESLDALLRLDGSFTRNNPAEAGWDKVDEEVGDAIIMALRYFAARGTSAERVIRAKIERMHAKKESAAKQGGNVSHPEGHTKK